VRPSVGRIVHYRMTRGGPCLAALIVAVHPTGNVNLTVFDEDGDTDARHGIADDVGDAGAGGRWHWPERVDEGTAAS